MYFLGVDGGGTKIEFWITQEDKQPIFQFILEQNSNLKYVGSAGVIAALQIGFEKMMTQFDLTQVAYAYFGIAECGNNANSERQKVVDFITKYIKNFTLADDQYSCFRSLSDKEEGVLGIAGTGSAINLFSPKGNKINKSIGHAGRDFGRMLLIEAKYGYLNPKSEIYKIVTNFLGQDPVSFYSHLTPQESILGEKITQIPKALSLEYYKGNIQLQNELNKYLVVIGGRWAHKLTTYCYANFGFREGDVFDIALTGSIWNWQIVLQITIAETKKIFPNVNIMDGNSTRPVLGCIKLAIENYQKAI